MTKRLFNFVLVAIIASGLIGIYPASKAQIAKNPVAIGSLPVQGIHWVAPREDKIFRDLERSGRISKDSKPDAVQLAFTEYRQKLSKKTQTWVNPKVAAAAFAHEQKLADTEGNLALNALQADPAVTPVTVTIFGLAADFKKEATNFTGTDCDAIDVNFTGPAAGDVPAPVSPDNATVWYEPAGIKDLSVYESLTFGYAGVGVVRKDLNSGAGVDLTGYTVQDYYDKVSGGTGRVTLDGKFNGWVTVPHDEAYYGAPTCDPDLGEINHDAKPVQLVVDAIDAFNTANPAFDWTKFDQDGDQIVDTFWLIHAGVGQEAGGGAQGGFALWSHSSDLRYYAAYPNGYQVAGQATPDDPTDDIMVGPYTMNPEMADVGVLAEEFGHNVFGLPDLYTTDVENSVGFWSIMASGSWGGPLGGAAPVGMPLWFRMNAWCGVDWCNWQYPMVTRDYRDALASIKIGTLEDTPVDTVKGVRVNLPKITEIIPNEAGLSLGAWSGSGRDDTEVALEKTLAVPAGAVGELSLDSFWDIEDGWDYGYVAVKEGAGNWVYLDDKGAYFTDANPNGNNIGNGLTGTATDITNLKFDLSAYAGKSIQLKLLYKLDAAANQNGWWVDNLKLDGALVDDFSAATGTVTFPGWTNSTPDPWYVVPLTKQYTNYYLLEYRGNTKYDSQAKTAYVTVDSGTNYWQVARVPYNIPGGLLYYRSTKYANGYSQRGYYADAPSYGPKNKLLVVDMNSEVVPIGTTGYIFNNRVGAYDATITLHATDPFTIPSVNKDPPLDPAGPYSYDSKPAVSKFNDVNGYYAGKLVTDPFDGYLSANRDGSVVIPARGNYSTGVRIDGSMIPAFDFYGATYTPSWLGSGRPGDANVQLGVNINMLDEQPTFGEFMFYNYSLDYKITETKQLTLQDKYLYTYTINVVNSGVESSVEPGTRLAKVQAVGAPIEPATLGIKLSDGLVLKSISAGQIVKPVTDAFSPYQTGLRFEWELPAMAAGESRTITLEAYGPVGAKPLNTWTSFYAWDGQADRGDAFGAISTHDPRGEWFYENDNTIYKYWMPRVSHP
jgi:immune inhibitor A